MNLEVDYFELFRSLVGHEYDFYGVDNNVLCIGIDGKKIALEAMENPDDGYRSYLDTVSVSLKEHIFFGTSLARVILEEAPSNLPGHDASSCKRDFEGYQLRDASDDHIWLLFGTDNTDEYYPCFTFRYEPKKIKIEFTIG